jgi:hypothetical protein
MAKSDVFGPWTPPGKNGKDPKIGEKDPTPTTPATLDSNSIQFWDSTTDGYIQIVEAPAWNRVKLGEFDLPGIVRVNVKMPASKVDKKDQKGKGGQTVTINGWDNASGTFECLIWTPSQCKFWRTMELILAPEYEKTPKPRDVVSPVLNPRIKTVLVTSVSSLEDGREVGTKLGKIEWIQNVPKPKATGGKPGSSIPAELQAYAAKLYAAYTAYVPLIKGGSMSPMYWATFLQQNLAFDKEGKLMAIPAPGNYIPPPYKEKQAKALS